MKITKNELNKGSTCCQGITRKDAPCRLPPQIGGAYCRFHSLEAPTAGKEGPRSSASQDLLNQATRAEWTRIIIETVGMLVALITVGVVLVQNAIMREQVTLQSNDNRIARRAQLLDIIYGLECARTAALTEKVAPETVESRSEGREGAQSIQESGDRAKVEGPQCWPKSVLRARAEAAMAFAEIEYQNGVLRPDLSGANLRAARLNLAKLGGASLSGADLREAALSGADLGEANMVRTLLGGADLGNTNLNSALLVRAELREALLGGTDLRDSRLTFADLRWADLGGQLYIVQVKDDRELTYSQKFSDGRGPSLLSGATLYGAKVSHAFFGNVDLSKTRGLSASQLEVMVGNSKTKIPEDFARPEHWALSPADQLDFISLKLVQRSEEEKAAELSPSALKPEKKGL